VPKSVNQESNPDNKAKARKSAGDVPCWDTLMAVWLWLVHWKWSELLWHFGGSESYDRELEHHRAQFVLSDSA
jgi:hypothetical protein